ncbi:MAG TPA: haloacid dehalogenase type II [Clostridia bacterium]|nr:haloacid dehalogenase type II [Clostridia bacterium]
MLRSIMLDFEQFRVLTFDCYGTLIDWETGILSSLRPILAAHNVHATDDALLEIYGELEAQIEAGTYRSYQQVMREVVAGIGMRLNFVPTIQEMDRLPDSVKDWQPFPDTPQSLQRLKRRYKLAIISNIDNSLFAASARQLGVEFDWVITAEEARSYKPSTNNFRIALQKIGHPAEQILHVAQSLYHDVVPAKAIGLKTVWINRRAGKSGFGATPPAHALPDIEVPDLKALATFAG